ncbi:MAG: radical SAM protein [Thermoanaerobaculaceae bacterium]|nr:radical SAM protein [Thermoanaerobaculaceae bacterium]
MDTTLSRRRSRFWPLPSPLSVLAGFLRYNLVYPLARRPLQPRALCLYVTYRCNFRCQMCGIWELDGEARGPEWSVEELDGYLDDPLFSRLEFVNLNGGEPNLRSDLPAIAELLLRKLRKLRRLTLNTNGVPPQRCLDHCERILAMCRAKGVLFSVSVSLHRLGPAYDEIVGVPNAFARVWQTLQGLRALRASGGLFLSTNCVLTPLSLDGAREMLEWGEREDIPVNFTVGEVRERFNNLARADSICFADPTERKKLLALLRDLRQRRGRLAHHALRYRELAAMVGEGRQRTLACHYALAGLILGSDGSLYYCKKSRAIGNVREQPAADIYWNADNLAYRRRQLLARECPSCLPNTLNAIELQKDLGKLVGLLR